MLKKITSLGLMLIMIFLLSACVEDYEYDERDFLLEITTSQPTAKIGDVIEVVVKLKNISGKDIQIQMPNSSVDKLEDIIKIALVSEEAVTGKIEDGLGNFFYNEPVGGNKRKFKFKKNQIISRTERFVIENAIDCEVVAAALFRTSHNFDNVVGIHSHYNNRIKINIIQGE